MLKNMVLCASLLCAVSAYGVTIAGVDVDEEKYPKTAAQMPAFVERMEGDLKQFKAFYDTKIKTYQSLFEESFPSELPVHNQQLFLNDYISMSVKKVDPEMHEGSLKVSPSCRELQRGYAAYTVTQNLIESLKVSREMVEGIDLSNLVKTAMRVEESGHYSFNPAYKSGDTLFFAKEEIFFKDLFGGTYDINHAKSHAYDQSWFLRDNSNLCFLNRSESGPYPFSKLCHELRFSNLDRAADNHIVLEGLLRPLTLVMDSIQMPNESQTPASSEVSVHETV